MQPYPFDLGAYSRTVSTDSADAQAWFDRGLNWIFGYHHEEAIVCFEHALAADANLAMAHWGIAYCIGPNYNKPWELFDSVDLDKALQQATGSLKQAQAILSSSTTNSVGTDESALINALMSRYPSTEPAEDLYAWSRAYADRMREVYLDHQDDPDVTTLYAEALMNLTPWQMWDPRTGKPGADAATSECREVLERGIAYRHSNALPPHPGLLHLYIHLMEMSPIPEVALNAADALRELVPDAGHLKHMATHIDVLCGNYKDVVVSNSSGIAADLKYYHEHGAMNFYSLYRVHNYHFKLYGAMFLGQYQPAIEAVQGIRDTIPDALVRMESPPMADWLEGYLSMETHALVRFGRWQQLIDYPLPEDQQLYSMTTAITWYGKAIAHAALKQPDAAENALQAFDAAAGTVSEDKHLHVVSCQDILAIARDMALGEMHYHSGSYDTAFDHLRSAIAKEDALPYDEPWGWMMPGRHALGALLLEQGRIEEATDVFEADLGLDDTVIRSNQHPDNVWALLGLHECYQRSNQSEHARHLKPRLDFALSRADPEIAAACFCSSENLRNDCCG